MQNNVGSQVLLIDDDKLLSPFVIEYLNSHSISVSHAPDGEEGLKQYFRNSFDLIILDVKMPFKDGFSVAEEIRTKDARTPIIFVTSQGDTEDRLQGLKLGGDDYLVKPYSLEELHLRIKNLLKRSGFSDSQRSDSNDIQIGSKFFHFDKRELRGNDESIQLTTTEASLLKYLLNAPNGIIEQEKAMREVWDDKHAMRKRSLTVYISKLRNYFKDDPNVSILNVHGKGYQLVIQKA
jgi:DNA-binding response OmpR family regulator